MIIKYNQVTIVILVEYGRRLEKDADRTIGPCLHSHFESAFVPLWDSRFDALGISKNRRNH